MNFISLQSKCYLMTGVVERRDGMLHAYKTVKTQRRDMMLMASSGHDEMSHKLNSILSVMGLVFNIVVVPYVLEIS